LSAPASSPRELIAFAGAVQCEHGVGAVNLVLRGYGSATRGLHAAVTEVLFSDATALALPSGLRDLTISELPAPDGAQPATGERSAARCFRIDSAGLQLTLQARSVQLHRDAAAAFYGAVPPPRVPLRLRLGWALLLLVLRIPGAGALLGKLRGAR
jgi:hypothetical protein